MSGKRYYSEDQAAASASRSQKRFHHDSRNTLSHDCYTVAWICALPLEMSAARAMLDDVHEALPQDVNDSNCYALGTIGKHRVTIACLPDGHYGTNNAAIVFTNLRRTFRNIQLGLMVGIGGGAPSKADLRLGDIVVGSAVIQHDMGKALGDGLFNRTSIPRPVPSSVSTVISSLRSKHSSTPSRVPSILRERSGALNGFERPVSTDRLFIAAYQHESSTPDCTSCDQSKLVQRTHRISNDPVIHYGAIASGNQVIKDSSTRDKLAEELDVICFEMEAAGMMDICPCLPVRGICDYSDSHKAKEWQKYAAATAAAYAREFLEELAVCKVVSEHQQQLQIYLDEKDKECLRDLRITNPEDDKEMIIKAKGGLLVESYWWVMENEDYQRWAKDNESRLLWVKGDPGKGKTMLLCGIINELESSSAPDSVFYFFCQASEPRLRSASAVLRGLIWFLARRQPNLIPHIRREYDDSGKDAFKDHNAWQALSNIMASILDHETTSDCIFVIDALDECLDDRECLIELVTRFSSTSKAKWIVSSRNWPEIEAQLDGVITNRVHLELNHSSIAEAVKRFITRRVDGLAKRKRYTESTRDAVLQHLLKNANDTFLWVSLVCEELAKYSVLPHHTSKVLQSFPPGLDKLYQRMINQILHSRDEETCKAILAVVTAAFEPLSLAELASSDDRLTCYQSDLQTLSKIVTCCGSFLSLRNDIVYTVHESVRDYLVTSSDIFPSSVSAQHYSIFQSTLQRIQESLHRNIYNAPDDTLYIHEISKPPSTVLDSIRYGCIYWVEHLSKSPSHAIRSLSTCSVVETFLKTRYLYWLEAMSLLRCVSVAIRATRQLGSDMVCTVQYVEFHRSPSNPSVQSETESPELKDLAEDALRFALNHRTICDTAPLQLYDSGLLFSPEQSQVRQNFISEISSNISIFPSSFQQWDACLFKIQDIADSYYGLKASPDGRRLAMAQGNGIIIILDTSTGETMRKINCHQVIQSILGFDAEGKRLATLIRDHSEFGLKHVTISNTYTGESLQTFEGDADIVVLSQDKMSLALAQRCGPVRVCDPWDGSIRYTIDPGHVKGEIQWIDFGFTKFDEPCVFSIVLTGDSYQEAEAVIQDPQTGQVLVRESLSLIDFDQNAALSPDGKCFLIPQTIQLLLWDGEMFISLRNLFGPDDHYSCNKIAWAPDGRSFAMSTSNAIILYDLKRQTRIGQVPVGGDAYGHLCYVSTTTLALLSLTSLQILGVRPTSNEPSHDKGKRLGAVGYLIPGPNGHFELLQTSACHEIITAVDNKLCRFRIPGSYPSCFKSAFSPDHQYAFVDPSGVINIWDIQLRLCLHKLRGHANDTTAVNIQFGPSGQLVSANHEDGRIRFWNPTTGDCLRTSDPLFRSSGVGMIACADGLVAFQPIGENAIYIWNSAVEDEAKTKWTMTGQLLSLSFNSNGVLAVLCLPWNEFPYLGILNVSHGMCLAKYRLLSSIPYARFLRGSESQLDVGHGVLDLDIERFTETDEVTGEERVLSYTQNDQLPWNQRFLRSDSINSERWIMRGSKKLLWIPPAVPESFQLTPNFDTGVSMVSMIYKSHPLIFYVR